MSKSPPSHSREGERERKARQRLSQPPENVPTPVPTPIIATPYGIPPLTPPAGVPQRTKGKTPEESGYPPGQVEVRIGVQGQKLWRLRGSLPNSILCGKA